MEIGPPPMRIFERTLPTAAANLALDDELLHAGGNALRFWESPETAIVLGRSQDAAAEIAPGADVPWLRRSTGGGAVAIGPGCLQFSFVLRIEDYPMLRDVRSSYCEILGSLAAALGEGVTIEGTSDLAWKGRKFSGNAQRRNRDAILHHGTILYAFPLAALDRCLREPLRRPVYRGARSHGEFVANLPLPRAEIVARISAAAASADFPSGPACAVR